MSETLQDDTKVDENAPKTGRPTKYRAVFAKQAKTLCEFGATDAELAEFFGVAVSTLYLWKSKSRPFSDALRVGKDAADQRVVSALYQQACDPNGPPLAKIYWTKNRMRSDWTDERKVVANMTLEQMIVGTSDDEDDDAAESEG